MSISKFILTKVLGWHYKYDIPEDLNKFIILAAPHTSIWDFAFGFFYCRAQGKKLHVMIKKESFFFPVGALLKAMGGFPMDRENPQATMMRLIHEFENNDSYILAICPEGTRKPVHKWKTGYHTIATHAGVPVYMGYFDYAAKEVGLLPEPVEITADARKDTDRIQERYKEMNLTALHPEGYVTE